jgi:hypothetical protein
VIVSINARKNQTGNKASLGGFIIFKWVKTILGIKIDTIFINNLFDVI